MVSLKSTLFFAATVSAATIISNRKVGPCSASNTPNCVCPEGTTLQQSTTRCHIKANAADVTAIVGSYHNTTWFGHTPDSVDGQDNAIGGSRTMTGGTPGGYKQFTETLFEYSTDKKGGFTMAYELENCPVDWHDKETGQVGSYAGYWDYLETKRLGNKHTRFDWRIYACFTTDESEGIKQFHEWALINVNAILESQGKSDGFSQEPFTIDSFHA